MKRHLATVSVLLSLAAPLSAQEKTPLFSVGTTDSGPVGPQGVKYNCASAVSSSLSTCQFARPERAAWNPYEDKEQHPLSETLRWIAPLAAGYVFDHKTSIDWSSKPTNCTEGNLSRRNPDGTLNGWKAAQYEIATGAAVAGTLYLAKRFHWRYVEVAAKSFTVAQVAESTWYGVSSLRLCHAVSR